MNNKQYRNLNLFTIRYPFTAIVSILHRLSGLFVFLFIPFLLWLLMQASSSPQGFEQIQTVLIHPIAKLMLWAIWVALWYHLLAGVRHLIMDIGFGESLLSARISGALALILTILLAAYIGIWLW